jgi:hypothetical protein
MRKWAIYILCSSLSTKIGTQLYNDGSIRDRGVYEMEKKDQKKYNTWEGEPGETTEGREEKKGAKIIKIKGRVKSTSKILGLVVPLHHI